MHPINISYAQALEDVHLSRALQDVPSHDGFYIDIGANDPERDSVTKVFYERGWRGINVDASAHFVSKLREQRPRDVNVEAAVCDEPGPVAFFDDAGGLSTTVESIAEDHKALHGIQMERRIVQTTTLTDLCAIHAPPQIHFLKIDVEGAEGAVLRSMDFSRFRPWVLCIESHYPMRPDLQVYQEWEPDLIASGYVFSYTDSINRYYLSQEHAHRAASFAYPAQFYIHADVARQIREMERRLAAFETCFGAIKKIAASM